jgi:hypothetical protein
MHVFNVPLSRLDAPSFWAEFAPQLGGRTLLQWTPDPRALECERRLLFSEGWARFEGVITASEAGALAVCIQRLVDRGIPALFAYVYDEIWQIAERLEPAAQAMLGDHDLLWDVWAWCLAISAGSAGWPPHRGVYELERAPDGGPNVLNVWVALTDATPDNACMYIVPLSRDPHYPNALHDTSCAAQDARALPAQAGTVLAWNANALHWGGRCDARATVPRISASFTFQRPSARALGDLGTIDLRKNLTLRERLDGIAQMIVTYGEHDPQIPPALCEWARVNAGLRARTHVDAAR